MEPIQALLYILYGVNYLNIIGPQPSPLLVEGNAFGVLKNNNNDFVVAAAHLSAGKIVSVAQEGLVSSLPTDGDDSYLLVHNIFQWLTMSTEGTPKIGILADGYDNLISNLEGINFTVSLNVSLSSEDLADVDAVFTSSYIHYTEKELTAIEEYVSNGGGLFVVGHKYTDYSDQILLDSGISYAVTREVYKVVPDPDYQPREFMLHNVRIINSRGQEASRVSVSGEAFSVLKTAGGRTTVAAAPLSLGRVVAVGHEGYVIRQSYGPSNPESSYIFTQSIVAWLAKCNETAAVGAIVNKGYEGFINNIASAGYTVRKISATSDDLDTVDVVLATVYTRFTSEQRDAIHSFVSNGGGLLLVGHTWYHSYAYAANDLIVGSGITITRGQSYSQGTTYSVLPNPPSSD